MSRLNITPNIAHVSSSRVVVDDGGAISLSALGGTFALPENAAQGDTAGLLAGRTDGSTLSLSNNAGGRVQLSGTAVERGATALDYEAAAAHTFTVRETLAGAVNSPLDTVFTLNVLNVDDTAPAFSSANPSGTYPESDALIGHTVTWDDPTAVLTISGTDAADPVVTPLTATSAEVELEIDYEVKPAHAYTYVLTDPAGLTATQAVAITVTDVVAPTITSLSFTGTVNNGQTITAATTLAGDAPTERTRTWSRKPADGSDLVQLASGSAAAMATIVINNATQGWQYQDSLVLTEYVANSEGADQVHYESLYLGGSPGVPSIAGTPPTVGYVGQSISFAPTNPGGGAAPIVWTATGLPQGLSINAATGEITGTLQIAPAIGEAEGAISFSGSGAGSVGARLNAQLTSAMPSTVTFVRGSEARAVNNTGAVATYAIDVPRFDHTFGGGVSRGFLVEQQGTNNLLRSFEYDNAYWSKASITFGANVAAPDGTTTARHVTGTIGTSYIVRNSIATDGQIKSVWARAVSGTGTVGIGGRSSLAKYQTTLTTTWQRFTFPVQTDEFASPSLNGTHFFPIDFRDGTLTQAYLWNSQLEAGAYATSDILTTGATATRITDTPYIGGTDFTGWWNASEGTFVVEASSPGVGQKVVMEVSDSNDTNFIRIWTDGLALKATIVRVGAEEMSLTIGTIAPHTAFKAALAFKANDCAAVLNGATVQTDASVTLPTGINLLTIGRGYGYSPLDGHIKNIKFYGTRRPNATLQADTL